MSIDFLEKHLEYLDWYNVCRYQELTEEFIERHQDKVDWVEIYKAQPQLSKEFFQRHHDQFLQAGEMK